MCCDVVGHTLACSRLRSRFCLAFSSGFNVLRFRVGFPSAPTIISSSPQLLPTKATSAAAASLSCFSGVNKNKRKKKVEESSGVVQKHSFVNVMNILEYSPLYVNCGRFAFKTCELIPQKERLLDYDVQKLKEVVH